MGLPTPVNLVTALELINAVYFCVVLSLGQLPTDIVHPVRIASGDKPVCILPFATDYQRGYKLGRHPVTSCELPRSDSSVWVVS
ncbi:MAG TPA: hypothetical protein V6D12_10830, partial [Candidatus Obscuribacterales bacterium]